jgi:hypothetical protein
MVRCRSQAISDADKIMEIVNTVESGLAAQWANCDPDSLYPRKDSDKRNVGTISIAADD